MDKQQKKRMKKYLSWILIAVLVAVLAFLPMIVSRQEPDSGPQASILSASAECRDISTAILGGGTLVAEESVNITIPVNIKVKAYLVKNGDYVAEGQAIAAADRVSIMSAISRVQEAMDTLQDKLNDAKNDTAPETVTASAGGTVKRIYGGEGENAANVMLRDGALAVLSLDGKMAVRIAADCQLTGADPVLVTFPDGAAVTGRVETNLERVITITVADEGYAPGESVSVSTMDGTLLGSGQLYIHSQWNAVAYSGTISRVAVREGSKVSAGQTLFTLKDTGHSAEFEALALKHREYEDLMLELFKLYQSEVVAAPNSGIITGVDETGAYMLAAQDGWQISLLANAPNGDDETAYVNYIGQVTEVGIDGLILKMNPHPLYIEDYMDLSTVPLDPALMTEDAVYTANAPMYELIGGEWVQMDAATIAPGDILLFAGDSEGNFVWVVRVMSESVSPEIPEETEPTEPSAPSEPARPDDAQSNTPSSSQSGGSAHGNGNMPSASGSAVQEEEDSLYSLESVTIASVIPQEQVTLQITVDEWDISQIHLGQPVQITVDALSGEKFTGTVTAIAGTGTNEGGNSKFTVDIAADMASNMLPGMTAYVSIPLSTAEGTLCLPVAALMESEGETYVYTGYDEEAKKFTDPINVITGISDGEYVQILSGIPEGQTVYYPYYDTLVISNAPEVSGGFRFR